METLKDKLKSFTFSWKDGNKLTKEFADLARYFISGGYIKVREDYRVYPTTVEFYFHSEKDDGVKDPIVYHRNNKYVQGEIPYFPMFSLHAHNSGYDITFENPAEKYRASVLIREYQILDVQDKQDKQNWKWLKWDKQCFREYNGENPINTQVCYLKYILNGISLFSTSSISWGDAETEDEMKDPNQRKNVPLYKINKDGEEEKVETKDFKEEEFASRFKNPFKEGQKITPKFFTSQKKNYVNDPRLWSFARKEPVPKPIK